MKVEVEGNLSFDLSILDLEKLKPHEETIPQLVQGIVQDMIASGMQRDPILADQSTGLILDGMHRRAALERVGAKLALCSLFDYDARHVRLERWLRSFSTTDRAIIEKLKELFDLMPRSNSQAIVAVDSGSSPFALISPTESFVSRLKPDVQAVYDKLAEFDRFCESRGLALRFLEEKAIRSDSDFVLYPMLIQKQDVRSLVRSGRVFPYKSTRHTVLVRPVQVSFPLELLQQGDRHECEAKLAQIVSSARPRVLKPMSSYGGRRYAEPIVVVES